MNDDVGNGFTVQDTVEIASTWGCVSTRIAIHAKQLKIVDGIKFLHMRTKASSIQRLVVSRSPAANGKYMHEYMKKSGLFKELLKAKNMVRNAMIAKGKENASSSKRWRPTLKMYTRNRLSLAEVIALRAPDVGDVKGMDIKVLCTPSCGKGKGLFMELSHANLEYVTNACAAAVQEGTERDDTLESASCSAEPNDEDDRNEPEDAKTTAPSNPLADFTPPSAEEHKSILHMLCQRESGTIIVDDD